MSTLELNAVARGTSCSDKAGQDSPLNTELGRRSVLQMLGASLGLAAAGATLTSCSSANPLETEIPIQLSNVITPVANPGLNVFLDRGPLVKIEFGLSARLKRRYLF